MIFPGAKNAVLGTQLTKTDQQIVLASYVYRFTGTHRPAWANKARPNGTPYRPHFKDDADWLAHTWFSVRKDGRLDRRSRHVYSEPTWPEGRE
jgi:hypothetical protein